MINVILTDTDNSKKGEANKPRNETDPKNEDNPQNKEDLKINIKMIHFVGKVTL